MGRQVRRNVMRRRIQAQNGAKGKAVMMLVVWEKEWEECGSWRVDAEHHSV